MSDEVERSLAPVITWRSTLVTSIDCQTCKLVALVLSLYMNERGGSAFPSNARLAEDCSLGISTVREHLNSHLHTQGWLTLIERGGTEGDTRKANEWQASTPRQLLAGSPPGKPLTPPPASGAQVVHNHEVENAGVTRTCSKCRDDFTGTLDAYMDHLQECDDQDFVPAVDLKVVGQ